MNKYLYTILLFILIACNNDQYNMNNKLIDITDCFQVQTSSFPLKSIIKRATYIDLYCEQKDTILLGRIEHLKVSNNYLLISDIKNKVFLFDTLGKFQRYIGKNGGGPGEFNKITDIDLIADRNIVGIWDSSRGRLYKYEINTGNFIDDVIIQTYSVKMSFLNENTYMFYAPEPFNYPETYKLLIYNNQGRIINKQLPVKVVNTKSTEIRAFPVHIYFSDTCFFIHESRNYSILSFNNKSGDMTGGFEYTFSGQMDITLKTDFYDDKFQITGFISQCIPLTNRYIYLKGVKENKVLSIIYDLEGSKCFRTSTKIEDYEIFQNPLEPAGRQILYDLLDYSQYYTILNNNNKLNMDEISKPKNRVFEQVIRLIYL